MRRHGARFRTSFSHVASEPSRAPEKRSQPASPGGRRDRRVAAMAAASAGVLDGGELRSCGLDRHAIALRSRNGRLHRLHHNVYAVGHPNVLAVGPLHRCVQGLRWARRLEPSSRGCSNRNSAVERGRHRADGTRWPRPRSRGHRGASIRVHYARRLHVQRWRADDQANLDRGGACGRAFTKRAARRSSHSLGRAAHKRPRHPRPAGPIGPGPRLAEDEGHPRAGPPDSVGARGRDAWSDPRRRLRNARREQAALPGGPQGGSRLPLA